MPRLCAVLLLLVAADATYSLRAAEDTAPAAWAMYFGGRGDDGATRIAADAGGNAYVIAGLQNSPVPPTPGVPDRGTYLLKFNAAGTRQYAVPLSGQAYDVAVASDGAAFIVGARVLPGDPAAIVPYTLQAYVMKVTSEGSVAYTTDLPGMTIDPREDQRPSIAAGPSGTVVVAGRRESGAGSFGTIGPTGGEDAVVVMLDARGAMTSTWAIGGSDADAAADVASDSAGNIYVAGRTRSGDFPVTPGAARPPAASLACDTSPYFPYFCDNAFVVKLDGRGGLVFATYYGGSREDRAVAIGVDRGGGVYVAGMTASRNFPVVRAVQPTSTSCPPVDQSQSSCGDAFVMHFDGTGAVVTFATYLGGSATVRALAVDALGFAYIVGLNRGNTLPVRRAPQPDNAAGPVVVSEDGGRTWVGAAGLRAMSVGAIAWSTEARPVAYASTARGLFRSTDFGRSWIEWGGLTRSVGAVAVDPATPAILYASAGAFLKSLDGGRSWTDISGGLPENVAQYVGSIAIAPSQPSTLYVSANGRIYASDDGGSTWRGGAGTGWSVAVNPGNPSRVYASVYNAGVKVSTDGARTWHTTFTVGREMYAGDIIINPMKPSDVYVALNTGVLRSVDSGETWQQIGIGWQEGPCSVAIDPTAPTDIWCAYHWINRLPASTSTFTFIDQPLAFIGLMSANSGRVLASASGASSGFVMSFDTSGAIAWSTYVGGTAGDPASDISAAGASVYVTGSTRSALWPLAQAGPRPFGGGSDLYIARYTIPR